MDGGGVKHDGEWAPDKGFEKLIAQREAKKAAGATGAVTAVSYTHPTLPTILLV